MDTAAGGGGKPRPVVTCVLDMYNKGAVISRYVSITKGGHDMA